MIDQPVNNINPYRVLCLNEDASIKQIKDRFRELSKVFHPDKQSAQYYDLTKQKFQEIETAYKMIYSQFNKVIFENFGPDAADIVSAHPNIFKKYEQILSKLDFDQLEQRELLEEIRQMIIYVYFKQMEKFSYSKVYTKHEILANLQMGNYSYLKSIYQENNQTLFFHNRQSNLIQIYLPNYMGTNQELYFMANHEKNVNGKIQASHEFGHRLARKFNINGLGEMTLSSSIGIANQLIVGNYQIEKQISQEFKICFTQKVQDNQLSSYVSLDYKNKESNQFVRINFFDHGQQSFQLQIPTQPSFFNVSINPHGFTVTSFNYLNNYKHFQNSFSNRLKVIRKGEQILLDFSLNSQFKCHFKKAISIELLSSIGLSKSHLEIIFTRGNAQVNLPIQFRLNILKIFEQPQILLKLLAILSIPFIIPYLWSHRFIKPPWQENMNKDLLRKKNEFLIQSKICRDTQEKIQSDPEFERKLSYEKQGNGLIIIQALLGLTLDIQDIFKNSLKTNILQLNNQEVLPITYSHLIIKKGTTHQLPGVFLINPEIGINDHSGIVEYLYRGQKHFKVWQLDEDLEIGNSSQKLGVFSMNQIFIKLFF